MSEPFEDDPNSIKYYVKRYILKNRSLFAQKKVLDLPAGSGVTTRILQEIGAKPVPCDLFPELFHASNIRCKQCDIEKGIPKKDSSFDAIISQEGMEHFANQYFAMKEMNRVLKKDGLLILTTPNYSSLQSRFSFLLFESENYKRFMPPNEYESIWFSSDKPENQDYYFGHVFLMSIQKLRLLWKLTGFELVEIVPNRLKIRNILLSIWYPLIWLQSHLLLNKYKRKFKGKDLQIQAFTEQFRLNLSPKILFHSHLLVVLRKTSSFQDARARFKNRNEDLKLNT